MPSDKVRHVLMGRPRDGHTCHWPDCTVEVPPAMLMCKPHWFMVPKHLRDRIWRAYKPGQENTKDPTPEWLDAWQAVEDWIKGRKHPPSGSVA